MGGIIAEIIMVDRFFVRIFGEFSAERCLSASVQAQGGCGHRHGLLKAMKILERRLGHIELAFARKCSRSTADSMA